MELDRPIFKIHMEEKKSDNITVNSDKEQEKEGFSIWDFKT